jgi:hypothetical protein
MTSVFDDMKLAKSTGGGLGGSSVSRRSILITTDHLSGPELPYLVESDGRPLC